MLKNTHKKIKCIGVLPIYGKQGQTVRAKKRFSKLNFNEFRKLSTKSCMSRTMNNLKESFTIMKAKLNNKKNNIENDDSVSHYKYERYVI